MPKHEGGADDCGFIREQYAQYHQMRRQYVSVIWNWPIIAILAGFLVLIINPNAVDFMRFHPKAASTVFFSLTILVGLLAYRNSRIRSLFVRVERVLASMEKDYGIDRYKVYAEQLKESLPWILQCSSSKLIGIGSWLVTLLFLVLSVCFWFGLFRFN